MNPFELNWGHIVPEYASSSSRTAVHVIAHRLDSGESVARNIRFLRARLSWFTHHLPEGYRQRVLVYDVGQVLGSESRREIREALSELADVFFYTQDGLSCLTT